MKCMQGHQGIRCAYKYASASFYVAPAVSRLCSHSVGFAYFHRFLEAAALVELQVQLHIEHIPRSSVNWKVSLSRSTLSPKRVAL